MFLYFIYFFSFTLQAKFITLSYKAMHNQILTYSKFIFTSFLLIFI